MKKYLVILALLLISSIAYAKESAYSISTALIGMSMDYREYDDNDKILDSEKSTTNSGALVGLDLGFAYTKVLKSGNYAELGGYMRVLSGETQYVGSLLTSSSGYGSYVGATKNTLFDTAMDYKFSHVLQGGFALNYGLGIGYRSWRRELSPSQIEVYRWFSIRPHVGALYTISKFSVGLDAEYQYGLNPKMDILANSENAETSVNLGGANILQISVPFNLAVHEKVDLFVVYTYENQVIDKSDTTPYVIDGKQYSILEPKSTANNQYAKFGATFKF